MTTEMGDAKPRRRRTAAEVPMVAAAPGEMERFAAAPEAVRDAMREGFDRLAHPDPTTDEAVRDGVRAAKREAREVSGKLKAELDRNARETGLEVSAQAARGDATPFGALPTPGAGYDRITERVFDLPDPGAEYDDLERLLVLGVRTYESVSEALDHAEDNARRAHRLYVNARVDAERFNIDADVIESAMRTQAVGELQREKDAGVRTKAITEGDTAAKVAALFPDEYRDLAERKVKSRKMVEHLEVFAKLWGSRCYSLSKMLETKR